MAVKEIVCYGDSNTWGYDPATGGRLPHGSRWTSVLQERLGSGYRIIPEGMNGRTTVFDDRQEGGTALRTWSPVSRRTILSMR